MCTALRLTSLLERREKAQRLNSTIQVATIAAGTSPLFAAVVSAHPSMVDPKDASPIAIPFALLASKDEDADACNGFMAGLKGEKYSETFHEMPHVGSDLFHVL